MTGKLVRDLVPEIIRASGREPHVRVLDDEAYVMALRTKLLEEAAEAAEADASQLLEELADVLEVLRALAQTTGRDLAAVVERADRKAVERGAFARRLFLESGQP